jgi:hypothetical protein
MGGNEGSIQRLPNGNTLVCNGIDKSGVNEFDAKGSSLWSMTVTSGAVFRYDSSYLGSTLLDTGNSPITMSNISASLEKRMSTLMEVRADRSILRVTFSNNNKHDATVAIYSATGRNVMKEAVTRNEFIWQTRTIPDGIYIIRATTGSHVMTQRFNILR